MTLCMRGLYNQNFTSVLTPDRRNGQLHVTNGNNMCFSDLNRTPGDRDHIPKTGKGYENVSANGVSGIYRKVDCL